MLEPVLFGLLWRPTAILVRVPFPFRGPLISDVPSVVPTVFPEILIPFRHECVGISEKRALRHQVCTVETDQAIA